MLKRIMLYNTQDGGSRGQCYTIHKMVAQEDNAIQYTRWGVQGGHRPPLKCERSRCLVVVDCVDCVD